MAQEIQTLIEMGFSKEKAERALAVTNNKGVEPAMEWLLAHVDDDLNAGSSQGIAVGSGGTAESPTTANPVSEENQTPAAKSLKCDECGKLFTSQDEAEFHAAKSGHSQFSESTEEKKPLTEEEKKEQLARLEERMREKRKEREEREKAETLEREKLRIRSGRNMQDAKQRLQEQEVAKMLEQRKRDKQEEKEARERVRKQIEADKLARKQAANGGLPPQPAPTPSPAPPPHTSSLSKTYDQARIQIRLPDGRALSQNFSAKEQLAAVRLYIQINAADFDASSFRLMTTFPKKVFEEEDFEKSLEALGLVPSAVIIVCRGL